MASDKTEYRDFCIYPTGFYAHPDWRKIAFTFVHKDYDGEGDHRCGTAPTVDDAKREIDEMLEAE